MFYNVNAALNNKYDYRTGVFPQHSVDSWTSICSDIASGAICSDIDSGRHLANMVTKSICP